MVARVAGDRSWTGSTFDNSANVLDQSAPPERQIHVWAYSVVSIIRHLAYLFHKIAVLKMERDRCWSIAQSCFPCSPRCPGMLTYETVQR